MAFRGFGGSGFGDFSGLGAWGLEFDGFRWEVWGLKASLSVLRVRVTTLGQSSVFQLRRLADLGPRVPACRRRSRNSKP